MSRLHPLRFITPRHIQRAAQLLIAPIMIGIALVYAQGSADLIRAAAGSYLLAITLLLAFPNIRSGDLAMTAVLFLTGAEFGSALQGTPVDFARWLVTMGTLGTVVVPLKAQRFRALALHDGWSPIAGAGRRRPRATGPIITDPRPSPMRVEMLLLPHRTDVPLGAALQPIGGHR